MGRWLVLPVSNWQLMPDRQVVSTRQVCPELHAHALLYFCAGLQSEEWISA
jgi:hypothetical protein